MRLFRLRLWGSAIALIPLGYGVRFYGSSPAWFQDALGSIVYEIFWIVLWLACRPKALPLRVSGTVFLLTCSLEFLQLWHPPLLQLIRATLPGRLVLGNTFSWTDFPAYGAGSLAGYFWVKALTR
jgi:Protein of unknown function (DUF2809)